MPLQIMKNIYPSNWFYLTRYYYVWSMSVKHLFLFFLKKKEIVAVAVVVCLFVVAFLLLMFFLLYHYYYFFNWYKLDSKFFAELCKVFTTS